MRIGHGYDVHALKEGLPFILGGIKIEHDKGFVAHSDGDVLIHSLMDALLGALALGDIGKHFPDTDEAYENINSMILLEKVYVKIKEHGYELGNADITIIAQKPKLSPFVDIMRKNIAYVLKTDIGNVGIKATTEEKLGFTGSESGIAVHSVVLLKKKGL